MQTPGPLVNGRKEHDPLSSIAFATPSENLSPQSSQSWWIFMIGIIINPMVSSCFLPVVDNALHYSSKLISIFFFAFVGINLHFNANTIGFAAIILRRIIWGIEPFRLFRIVVGVLLMRMLLKGCEPILSSFQEVLYDFLDSRKKLMTSGLCEERHAGDVDSILKQMIDDDFEQKLSMWKQILECINIVMDQSAGLRMFGSNIIKLDRMDGMNFTGWKEKMKFLLIAFKRKQTPPYESSCKLVENNGRAITQIEYASAIGCLMYATHCTRPDIAYVVCKLSRYTSNPSQDHWKAIRRVFGYLKRTRQLALYYDCFPAVLEGYSDASWITGSSDSKSTTGWIFTLGGGAICWGSKKQTCITHSTMEAEFLALAAAGKETEWLRNMLLDIELWLQLMSVIFLHCDSQSTLSRAYNKVYNGKSRHISLRHAYIKELISNGIITIEYIRSCKNLADPFTKGLPKDIVFGTTREMGLKPIE
nr:zinc finger, CCHC-type [Tanacetum cinerariifolium]